MSDMAGAAAHSPPTIDSPWSWLAAGWRDMAKAGAYSLAFGVFAAAAGLAITAGLWFFGQSAWIPAIAGGFALVGPFVAAGLYEISRRLEAGEPLSWRAALRPRTPAPSQLAMLGLALCLIFLIWIRAAEVIFAVYTHGDYPDLAGLSVYLLTTADGLSLLAVGTVVGAFLALTTFAISATSAPMLIDRNVDVVTAIIASVGLVRRRPGMMLLWAWIVALLVAIGVATAFVGLIVIFPVLGHASWHAYRSTIDAADADDHD